MSRTTTADAIVIKKRELKSLLREVVREVVHDELSKFAATPEEDWDIEEGSVLWHDLIELKEEARDGRLRLYARKEDFRE